VHVGPRREQRAGVDGDLHELAWRPDVPEVALEVRRVDLLADLGVVGDAAGVVQQLTERDVRSVGDGAGLPALDGVPEIELALLGELHDDGRDVGLGEAADAEAIVRVDRRLRLEVRDAGGELKRLVAVTHEDRDARYPEADEPVHLGLDRGLVGDVLSSGVAAAPGGEAGDQHGGSHEHRAAGALREARSGGHAVRRGHEVPLLSGSTGPDPPCRRRGCRTSGRDPRPAP
jgi:hypothetical protein